MKSGSREVAKVIIKTLRPKDLSKGEEAKTLSSGSNVRGKEAASGQLKLFSVDELCRALGISRSKLYLLIGAGDLTPRKIGRRTVFLSEDVQNWIARLPTASQHDVSL